MDPIVVAVTGPFVAAFFGLTAFTGRRIVIKTDAQLEKITRSVEHISETVTNIQIDMPQRFVTREDFFRHIADEEKWQDELRRDFYEVKDQLHAIRSQPHN